MNKSNLVFDKTQRKLVSDAIRGRIPGSVKVDNYSIRIEKILEKWEVSYPRDTIYQHVINGVNNQDVFRAAFIVLQEERPELTRYLFNGKLMSLQPA